MKPEEKHFSFSIERFEDVSKAFEDVGGPKSGIKLTGEDHAIWVNYSNASKETMQQFKQALLKHTIKNTLKTKGVTILQVCCLLTVLGALLKGFNTGLDYLTSPCKKRKWFTTSSKNHRPKEDAGTRYFSWCKRKLKKRSSLKWGYLNI